jgi:hypothetical protein
MIHSTSVTLKLDKLYERSSGVDIPYYITRRQENGEVVWFGFENNWKFFDNKWHILNKNEWVVSEKPIYEELYEFYSREELRDRKLSLLL